MCIKAQTDVLNNNNNFIMLFSLLPQLLQTRPRWRPTSRPNPRRRQTQSAVTARRRQSLERKSFQSHRLTLRCLTQQSGEGGALETGGGRRGGFLLKRTTMRVTHGTIIPPSVSRLRDVEIWVWVFWMESKCASSWMMSRSPLLWSFWYGTVSEGRQPGRGSRFGSWGPHQLLV